MTEAAAEKGAGVSLQAAGIGSAFWGLLAGLAVFALTRWRPRRD